MSEKPTYWRSLNDLERSPEFEEFLSREFPHAAAEDLPPMKRRRFVQLLGASLALAGCRWQQEKLMPFSRKPGDAIPGVPKRFATSMDLGGSSVGLLVTSYDGRPIKIEGNPNHPESLGAATTFHQASILDLYDPDRQTKITALSNGVETDSTWEKFVSESARNFQSYRRNAGRGLRVLSLASSSPTLARLKERLLQTQPDAQWIEYEPISRDSELEGAKIAFGKPYRTHIKLDSADVILSLDADFLSQHPCELRLTREFANRRVAGDKGNGSVNRLYIAESRFSPTGAKADHRLPLRAEQIKPFLLLVESKATDQQLSIPTQGTFLEDPYVAKFAAALAEDLKSHKGKSVVVVGRGQPAEVHAIAHRLNAALGNVGHTVAYSEEPEAPGRGSAFANLVKDMAVGDVKGLLILGCNPVYDAPADQKFAEALAKVPFTVHVSPYKNETSALCQWRIPEAHYLETWSDSRSFDGTVNIIQPLIDPIYPASKSALEMALHLLQMPIGLDGCLAAVRETHGFATPKGAAIDEKKEAAWRTIVEAGFIKDSDWNASTPTLANFPASVAQVEARALKPKLGNDELEVVFVADSKVYDGRFANNGWLQEVPESMTKLTWDNAALMSKQTAESLGLAIGTEEVSMIRLTNERGEKRELEVAALVVPGHPIGTITLALGYGRTAAGYIGGSAASKIEAPGFNTYRLRSQAHPNFEGGFKAVPTGGTYLLVCTQEHHIIDVLGMRAREKRLGELIYETTSAEASKDGWKLHTGAHHGSLPVLSDADVQEAQHERNLSSWHEWEYKGHRWGMSIDLSKCTGCNACTIACQAENNIPIVGKDQVWRNREMHWLRLDRYFKGDVEHPEQVESVQQPMTCQQCENAPCESVCPVAATTHTPEGLNDMVYNRCVGTRYCSNNCPYKVRRFNFYNYQKMIGLPENDIRHMVYNPEVTVRMRGVMEKCTYCVQRIQNVKIVAKREGRPIKDGEITTACAQTCAAGAIVFGDLGKVGEAPQTAVAKEHASKRAYTVLEELNNKPRTKYLAVVRNPNPKLVATAEKASDEHGHSH